MIKKNMISLFILTVFLFSMTSGPAFAWKPSYKSVDDYMCVNWNQEFDIVIDDCYSLECLWTENYDNESFTLVKKGYIPDPKNPNVGRMVYTFKPKFWGTKNITLHCKMPNGPEITNNTYQIKSDFPTHNLLFRDENRDVKVTEQHDCFLYDYNIKSATVTFEKKDPVLEKSGDRSIYWCTAIIADKRGGIRPISKTTTIGSEQNDTQIEFDFSNSDNVDRSALIVFAYVGKAM